MPLFYQHQINQHSSLAVWHIAEPESFFLDRVSLQRDITHRHKRLQHLAGRYLLTELQPDFPAALIEIADTRKPFLPGEAFHFSISHCGDYAAAMISTRSRVGVDIELISEKVAAIKHKFLSESEYSNIQNSKYNIQNNLLTACWSIKESIFKWYGEGGVDFKSHIIIDNLTIKENECLASCRFMKDGEISLKVQSLFFNNNCLSWVIS